MLSGGRQQRAYLSLKAQGKIKVYFEEYVIRRFFGVGSQTDKTCKIFAQELRKYVLIAGMGVGVAFTHIPLIYICKQMHFFQDSSAFYK